jgi:hypothetical protein
MYWTEGRRQEGQVIGEFMEEEEEEEDGKVMERRKKMKGGEKEDKILRKRWIERKEKGCEFDGVWDKGGVGGRKEVEVAGGEKLRRKGKERGKEGDQLQAGSGVVDLFAHQPSQHRKEIRSEIGRTLSWER